jgi:hypothetical protein
MRYKEILPALHAWAQAEKSYPCQMEPRQETIDGT